MTAEEEIKYKKYLKSLNKDALIDLYIQKVYEANIMQEDINSYKNKCKKLNQDKISFTIKQLEKTIDTVENVLDKALKNNSCNSSYYDKLLDLLDQQIKELKGKK